MELIRHLADIGCTVSQKAVSRWECGDTEPNIRQFLFLCEIYGVRDALVTFCGKAGLMSGLNSAGKQRVSEYIRLLEGDEDFSAVPRPRPARLLRSIPLYDMPVSAGTGQFLDSSDYELIEVDETVPISATFAVRISGDSMTPRFVDTQIIYIKQQQTLEPDDIGIFILDGDAYCKQLSMSDGKTQLISINSKYPPIEINEYSDLRVLGKVVS